MSELVVIFVLTLLLLCFIDCVIISMINFDNFMVSFVFCVHDTLVWNKCVMWPLNLKAYEYNLVNQIYIFADLMKMTLMSYNHC